MDFDSFPYPAAPPSPENQVPTQNQNLLRFGSAAGDGPGERFALYNYHYDDGAGTVFGGDKKWGIAAETAFDNLNGGTALTSGISGWITDWTVPESTDGFSLMLDILPANMYRFRVVDDGVTEIDVSGQLKGDASSEPIAALTMWSEGGDTSGGKVPTTYFNNLQIVQTPPDALPGDFNNDGKVDAADYVVWRKTDESQTGYDMWRSNFGRTAGAGSLSGAAVPEPTCCVLLILGAALGSWARHRSGRGCN